MRLAWSMVRHRFAAFAGTFLAVLAGVAVVSGATSIWASSRPQVPDRYADAPVLVHAPSIGDGEDGYPIYRSWSTAAAAELAGRLAALPGVAAAVPDPEFYVQRLRDGRATGDPETARTDGHAWSSAALGGHRLTAGTAPARDGEVVLSGAAPGDTVDVLTAAGPATWRVVGTTDGPGFYLADATAGRLASGVQAIGLRVTGDPERVAAAARTTAGDAGFVLAGDARADLEPEAVSRIRWLGAQLLIALVGLGTFVAVFVVSSTCALGAAQRRRELALLRAVGATPGQVGRMMYAETLVVAVLAGLAGAPLGALAAPLLGPPLVRAGLEPAGFAVTVQPVALAGSFALGVVVALLGTGAVAWRSSRIPALDALREASVEKRAMTAGRWVTGLLAAAGGAALLVALPSIDLSTQSTAGMGAAMLLLTAAALLAPVLIGPLVRLATWPWRRSATGMLVREGTLTALRRVASTAAPVLLTVGFTVLLTGTVATVENVAGVDEAKRVPAATLLVPDGTPGLTAAAVDAQPGPARTPTRVLVTHGGAVTGVDATGVTGARGLQIDPLTAESLGAAAGTRLTVTWRDGTSGTVPVAAVRRDLAAPMVLPRDLVLEHDPAALSDAVLLAGDPVAAPGARVLTARQYADEEIDADGRLIDLFLLVLLGMSAGYTGLAVANTLLMATAGRRPEFRALRLAGAATAQILRVTWIEALLAVVAGTVLGATVAGFSLLGVSAAVGNELDLDVPVVVPWGGAAAVTGLCALVACVAVAAPVLRRR